MRCRVDLMLERASNLYGLFNLWISRLKHSSVVVVSQFYSPPLHLNEISTCVSSIQTEALDLKWCEEMQTKLQVKNKSCLWFHEINSHSVVFNIRPNFIRNDAVGNK